MELTIYQKRVLELLKISRELKDYARGRRVNDKLILTHYSIEEWSYGITYRFGINYNNGFGDAFAVSNDHLDTMTDEEWIKLKYELEFVKALIDRATTSEVSTKARIIDAVNGKGDIDMLVSSLETIINDYRNTNK